MAWRRLGIKRQILNLWCWTVYLKTGDLNQQFTTINEPGHDKTNKISVHPAKTQISLGIRPVWSESSLSAWRNLGSLATHWAHSEDSDQTGQMPRLIWVFAGCTVILLVLSWGGSNDSGTSRHYTFFCPFQVQACFKEAERFEYLVQSRSSTVTSNMLLTSLLYAPLRTPKLTITSGMSVCTPSMITMVTVLTILLLSHKILGFVWEMGLCQGYS